MRVRTRNGPYYFTIKPKKLSRHRKTAMADFNRQLFGAKVWLHAEK